MARIMGDGTNGSAGTGTMRPADYIALSTDATAPNAANTTLPGEIDNGGTLDRAQAVYAHTNGQATYTLTKTFTSDATVTIEKIGVFNAATGGTLVFETLLAAEADLVPNDQVMITETVTL
ncbi:MAG: hypothetical protein R3330_04210 [Saprospiraceae bacterium]|nr:hypothetical protein [Saprospiraceae bacterium]